jgi:hypothetical protein
MALRTGFGVVIPVITLVVYLTFRIPGRIGELAGATITLALFAMPLAGLWESGQSQSTVLNGLIPLYDAENYYIDALGLINGSKFSTFSARRPLFPGLLAVLLSITNHNLMASLAILTGIAGFACYFSVREIQRTHGAEAAVFVLMILFMFYRAHSGVSMSENLGVALGTLGFALLWQGVSNKNLFYICAGLFTTTLALNARAGAFFMLPLLIVWVGCVFRQNKLVSWKVVFITAGVTAFGFIVNLLLTRLIAISSGVPFANFSYTLYGLASGGKSWAYIFEAHPEVLLIPEPGQTKRIYELAIQLIRTNPLLTLQGALYNWKMLFSDTWYSMYAYIGGENWIVNIIARWGLYILSVMGIYAWFQDRKNLLYGLVMVSVLGIFISVPFMPPTDAYRMRAYAASIVIFAALPAMGFAFLLKKTKLDFFTRLGNNLSKSSIPLVFSSILISITLIGPILILSIVRPPSLKPVACITNEEFILVRFDEGTHLNIKKQNRPFLDRMPNYHIGQFKENSHSLGKYN